MTGIEAAYTNTGYPYRGGQPVEFSAADIAEFGKLSTYGDNRILFAVFLKNDPEKKRLVFIKACDQTKEEEKFLRKIAKKCPCHAPPRFYWTWSWIQI